MFIADQGDDAAICDLGAAYIKPNPTTSFVRTSIAVPMPWAILRPDGNAQWHLRLWGSLFSPNDFHITTI
jgi:hypothetical protein